jgi:lipoprotein-anchoring transpeptidase ErfK/SrfK
VRRRLCGVALRHRIAMYMVAIVTVGLATIALGSAVQPASAQQGFGNLFGYQTQTQRKRVRKRRVRRSRNRRTEKKKEVATKAPSGPLLAVVSLGSQHVAIYGEDGVVARSRVSSGKRGLRTPTGVFSIIQRHRHHHSNIYSGASMPYMQRITWSGIAMHASGSVPGYPASHGCIRLPYSFAKRLWGLTKMGTRVIVSPRDTKPFAISHAVLPMPKLYPAPDATQHVEQAAAPETTGAVALASLDGSANVALKTAGNTPNSEKAENATPAKLNPIEYAALMKTQAVGEKLATEKAAKAALKTANTKAETARGAVDDVKEAQAALGEARAKVATHLDDDLNKTSNPDEREAASKAMADADTGLRHAHLDLAHARAREAVATPAAFDAVQAWKDAVAAKNAAKAKVKEASRRSKPVSVFISKKEGRVFIRQAWKEVYEAPVKIRDAERPLGTHVYMALGVEQDGSALKWTAVTMPQRGKAKKKSRKRRRGKRAEKKVAEPATPKRHPPETAAGALERIEMPEDVRRQISELIWTGASLIVSDNARSHEMGEYTGFIVLTR